jgi:hypothetical protein
MTAFSDLIEAARRLAILKALAEAPEYTLPEGVAREALKAHGLALSADQMAVSDAWLDDAGLLMRHKVGATALLILTTRGLDAAEGTVQVPGVDRPRPGH